MNDRFRPWLNLLAGTLAVFLLGLLSARLARAQAAPSPEGPAQASDTARLRAEADRLFASQKYGEALRDYLKVYPSYRNSFEVNQRIGWIYINQERGQIRKAIPYLRRAHELNPSDAGVLHNLAQATAWAGQFDESIPLYRQWLKQVPAKSSGPLLEFARALNWAGQNTESVKYYQLYLNRAPSDMQARLELGRIMGQQKDYAGALEQYNYVLRFRPRDVTAQIGVAQVEAWTGQLQESLEDIEKVLKTNPNHFDARLVEAYDLLWLGRAAEARQSFQMLAKQNPGNADVQQGLKQAESAIQAKGGPSAPGQPVPPSQAPVAESLQLARESENQGNYAQAIARYREYLAQHPENADAQFRLATVLGWNKDYAESESMLRQWVQTHPDNPEGIFELARVLSWQEKYPEAIQLYQKGLTIRPDDAGIHVELARILSYTKQFAQSADEYRRAISLQPSNAEAHEGLVQVLIWNDDLGGAKNALGVLRNANPDDEKIASLQQQIETTEAREARAKAISQGRAKEYFEGLVAKDPSNVDARLELVDLDVNNRDFNGAIEQLRASLQAKPQQEQLRLRLARVLSWNQQYPQSVEQYRVWLNNHPDDQTAQVELARVLSWNKSYDASVTEYRKVLQQKPDDVEARLELARVLTWSRQYDESLQEYETVLKKDPKNFSALVGEGRIYSYQSRWKESEQAYDQALAIQPNDREALTGKAQTLLWSGKARPARTLLKQLESENSQDATVLVSLASAENALGRPDKALDLLDQAGTIAPNNTDVTNLRRQIKSALRPELRLGWGYLRDTESLNSWQYSLDFRFNLHPRLRNFITFQVLPTSARADVFGYPTFGSGFARRVPLNPYIPSPTLLTGADFPSDVLTSGSDRIRQNAAQFMAGGQMRMSSWLSWEAGVGAVELRHGSPELQGFPSTVSRVIYTATPTFYIGRSVQIVLSSSRRYWAYTPKAIAQELYVDEQSATLVLNPTSRTRIALGGFHREVRPGFQIPDVNIPGDGVFTGRAYKMHGNGGTLTGTQAVWKGDRGYVELGYDGMLFGYTHPEGLPASSFYVNTGVFTPSFYQRHAGLFHSSLNLGDHLRWDLHGTAGVQQVFQHSDYSFSSTGGSRLDIIFSDHMTLSLGYDYFNAASAVQALIEPTKAAGYHSNQASVGLDFKF